MFVDCCSCWQLWMDPFSTLSGGLWSVILAQQDAGMIEGNLFLYCDLIDNFIGSHDMWITG